MKKPILLSFSILLLTFSCSPVMDDSLNEDPDLEYILQKYSGPTSQKNESQVFTGKAYMKKINSGMVLVVSNKEKQKGRKTKS